jgi:hypothetical protein
VLGFDLLVERALVSGPLVAHDDDGNGPRTARGPGLSKRTPAMAAGVADHIWTLQEIAGLLDANPN